jgi:uncharacterized membrane protein
VRSLRGVAAVLCALPWLRLWSSTPIALGNLIDLTFLPLCHHWSGRVLLVGAKPMCVCSRCAGLYAGLAVGFVLSAPSVTTRTHSRLLALALGIAVVEVALQDAGVHAPYHPTRLATGAFVGWAAAAWMVEAAISRLPGSPGRGPRG